MFGKKIQIDDYGRPYIIVRGKKERLITLDDLRPTIEKINLILAYLNLEYVPETEKKEPAKLVEKEKVIECDVHPAIHGFFTDFPDSTLWNKTAPKKKKRGRPKKK